MAGRRTYANVRWLRRLAGVLQRVQRAGDGPEHFFNDAHHTVVKGYQQAALLRSSRNKMQNLKRDTQAKYLCNDARHALASIYQQASLLARCHIGMQFNRCNSSVVTQAQSTVTCNTSQALNLAVTGDSCRRQAQGAGCCNTG